MTVRRHLTAALLLSFAALGLTNHGARAQDAPVPPALGDTAREAVATAWAEMEAAAARLAGRGAESREDALADALRRVVDARAAIEQAVASAKAAGTVPDTATDRMDQAIDKLSEVANGLRQLNPPVLDVSLEAAMANLEEAAEHLYAAAGRLPPTDQ